MNLNLFVYGTLKRGFNNNTLLTNQQFVGTAKTVKSMIMEDRGIPFIYDYKKAYKGNKLYEGSPILGELWNVSEDALKRIDGLEGHPDWYTRRLTQVVLDDWKTYAWLYYMTPKHTKDNLPYFPENAYLTDIYEI